MMCAPEIDSMAPGRREPRGGFVAMGSTAALAIVALVACKSTSSPDREAPTAQAEPTAPAEPTAAPEAAEQPAQPTAPEPSPREAARAEKAPSNNPVDKAVQAFSSHWADTQNKGRFEQYAALYGEPFQGVRRSGDKTATLDRQGWLSERKRMFGKPMSVEVGSLTIKDRGNPLVVEFTQIWRSGTYGDKGRKQMHLVANGSSYLIVREEMLYSAVFWPTKASVAAMFPDREDRPEIATFECERFQLDSTLGVCLLIEEDEEDDCTFTVALLRQSKSGMEVLDTYPGQLAGWTRPDEDDAQREGDAGLDLVMAGPNTEGVVVHMEMGVTYVDSDSDGPYNDYSLSRSTSDLLFVKDDQLVLVLSANSSEDTGDWSEATGMQESQEHSDFEFVDGDDEEQHHERYYDILLTESSGTSTERGKNTTSSENETLYVYDSDKGEYAAYDYSE